LCPNTPSYHSLSFFISTTPSPPTSTPLSLHDALPIFTSMPCIGDGRQSGTSASPSIVNASPEAAIGGGLSLLETGDRIHDRRRRSEEHTSELQSRGHLVCRLLLEKKKIKNRHTAATRA